MHLEVIDHQRFGKTGLGIPPIVFGTSSLGNLYTAISPDTKHEIVRQWFEHVPAPVVVDLAGKYGAGLALECTGKALAELGIPSEKVIISNKLGWRRAPLSGPEPTFEPGAWVDLEHDAVQDISYDGMLRCWEEGCELLGNYRPQLVSVHDPDEYLAAASSEADRKSRWEDIIGAYRALGDLRKDGVVAAIGAAAKDWKLIRRIAGECDLDWVMIANSFTLLEHPNELLEFIAELAESDVGVINSAVFHSGFLIGGSHFDYAQITGASDRERELIDWRERFLGACNEFEVAPAAACVRFSGSPTGVNAIALNSGKPDRVGENVQMFREKIPSEFWIAMKSRGLLDPDYPHL